MAQFPTREAQISALADHPAVFSAPPVIWGLLNLKKVIYQNARDAQPAAAELEYKVLAVNKTGTGPESNTVMAVL